MVSQNKILLLGITFFWPSTQLLVVALPFLAFDRRMRVLWATLFVTLAAVFAVIWSNSHYAAPLVCVFYGLIVQAIRHLRVMAISQVRFGLALSRVIMILLILQTANFISNRICDPLMFPCGGKSE